MKYFLVAALLFMAPVLQAQEDYSLYLHKEFTARDGKVIPYRILYPQSYNPSIKYPVVLFLHGAGERGSDNASQLKHGAGIFMQENYRKKYPCFVIFPQCPVNDFWSSVKIDGQTSPATLDFDYSVSETESLSAAIAILKQVMAEESVEKTRIYIIGLSMGGMGTFEAVYRYPELFASAMPICGGGDAKRYDRNLNGIYFWVFHGDQDQSVDVKYSRDMVDRLKELKLDYLYSEYPGVKHNSWDNAFAEKEFIPWMFSHKRKVKSK